MPEYLEAECIKSSKEERRDGGIIRQHRRRARQLYETIRADLLAENYQTATAKVEAVQEPCPHCGHRPVFEFAYPDFYLDPSGFAILESVQRSSISHVHQAPPDYPLCLYELVFVSRIDGREITLPTYQQLDEPAGSENQSLFYALPLRAFVNAQANGVAPEVTPIAGCDITDEFHCEVIERINDAIDPEMHEGASAEFVEHSEFLCQPPDVYVYPQLAVLRLWNGNATYCILEHRSDAESCIHICCL